MDSMEQFVREFVLWHETYNWGKIIIGRDVAGYLILYGIVKGDKCFWNTILDTENNFDGVILRARELVEEIEKDPDKYIRRTEWNTISKEFKPQRFGRCRCVIEPTE
jgi:hypothetical protein